MDAMQFALALAGLSFSIIGTLTMIIFNRMSNSLIEIDKHAKSMSEKLAVVIQRQESQADVIDDVKKELKEARAEVREIDRHVQKCERCMNYRSPGKDHIER